MGFCCTYCVRHMCLRYVQDKDVCYASHAARTRSLDIVLDGAVAGRAIIPWRAPGVPLAGGCHGGMCHVTCVTIVA